MRKKSACRDKTSDTCGSSRQWYRRDFLFSRKYNVHHVLSMLSDDYDFTGGVVYCVSCPQSQNRKFKRVFRYLVNTISRSLYIQSIADEEKKEAFCCSWSTTSKAVTQEKWRWIRADLTKQQKMAKFPWTQQAVDLSRLSTQMNEKNIAGTATIWMIVRWKRWWWCWRQQEQPSTLTLRVISFAELIFMLCFLHLKSKKKEFQQNFHHF